MITNMSQAALATLKSIERHLAQTARTYSIVRDREFSKSQEALKAKKKHLRTQGKGRKPNKAREVTLEEFEKNVGKWSDRCAQSPSPPQHRLAE